MKVSTIFLIYVHNLSFIFHIANFLCIFLNKGNHSNICKINLCLEILRSVTTFRDIPLKLIKRPEVVGSIPTRGGEIFT